MSIVILDETEFDTPQNIKNKVINLKRFTLKELKEYFMTEGEKYSSDVFINKVDDDVPDNEELHLGDHLWMEAYKGSENLYFDFTVYRGDCVAVDLKLYTKDAHDKLKHFIHEIIKQA